METQRVLYVGCGHDKKAHEIFTGWELIRLDVDPAVKPDIVASMTQMRPVPSGSVDAVYSRHNLEHLEYHEVALALGEFRRVLKPDGFALIIVPDLQIVAELILEGKLEETAYISAAGPIAPIDMLFGFRPALRDGKYYMAHRMGFTQRTLLGHIVRAGFSGGVVRAIGTKELWAEARTLPGKPDQLAKLFPRAGAPTPVSVT
jgi:SAM-dependent methyltransferase